MSSDSVPFGDIVESAIGGGWGANEGGEVPVMVIRGTDIPAVRRGLLEGCPLRFETSKRVAARSLSAGDLVLEVSGGSAASGQHTGRAALVTESLLEQARGDVIPASFCRRIRLDTKRAFPRYAYFHLLDMHASGRAGVYENQSTGISNFQFQFFLSAERIRLPPLAEQRRIAWVLGSLDDKIELNRRLAQTLEEIAAAIFKARFIDFEGVTEFQDSEMGPIPKGWRVMAFSNCVEINPRVKISRGEVTPFVEMSGVSPWSTRPARVLSRPYSGGAKFDRGDTLFARITGCIEHGKGAFVDFLSARAAGSTEFLVFRATDLLTPEAVFLLSRTNRVRDHALTNMTGSSGRQRAVASSFDHLPIAIPPDLTRWTRDADLFKALFSFSRSLWDESSTLEVARDALLPKLIAGRVRVPEGAGPDLGPKAETA